jgi:hypothetical protein
MSLISCPECGTQVSDKAKNCPKCAYPINPEVPRQQSFTPAPPIVVKPKEGCFLQTLNVGCMIVAVIVGIIILVVLVSNC